MQTKTQNSLDEERISGWVNEHGPAVRGFLSGLIRRADVVDDLSQETFYRAWRGRQNYAEQGQSRAYLLRVADNVACDWLRRKKPESNLGDEVWNVGARAGSGGDPLHKAAASEVAHRLNAALDQLTQIQQRVLLLRYYGQLSFNEIAETVDSPLNSVLSHCHRGLQALRKILGETTYE